MNTTALGPPVDRALTRRALAAAFNPKGILAQASSPEACFEYDFIRKDFEAYDEVTSMGRNWILDENAVHKDQVLMGPSPKTTLHNQQPENRQNVEYNW